ncbi:hypothetical protein FSP39_018288 [Pinctada imbricata]|uniref:DAGKc domain-containing protein n=1 Tax=Pinctada imbricata TaxID=66713 RepID=A0AA88XZR5_PINIB|nr:hypothetical protein FSP39_018288 [Pinctada imbricata]
MPELITTIGFFKERVNWTRCRHTPGDKLPLNVQNRTKHFLFKVAIEYTRSKGDAWEDDRRERYYFIPCILRDNILQSRVLTTDDQGYLEINFLDCSQGKRYHKKKVTISGDLDICTQIHHQIQEILSELKRPKRFLVFINPNSGHKKAGKVYGKYVAPLYDLCGVQTDVIVTSHAKHATEFLLSCDLKGVDGVIAVGGDGILNEVIMGVLKRTQIQRQVNYDDPNVAMEMSNLPVGIIPAGSGNVIAQYLYHTKCPFTAAAKILQGHTLQSNVASVHMDQKMSAVSSLILGFGLFGDMMKECEKHRNMGPSRYNVIPILSMMKRRTVDVNLSYQPMESNKKFRRQASCPGHCMQHDRLLKRAKSTSDILEDQEDKHWEKISDRVFAIDTHPIMMTPKDGKLGPSFGKDHLNVFMTGKCGLLSHVTQLAKVKEWDLHCYNTKFIREIQTQRFKIGISNTMKDKDFYINCDGEALLLTQPSFEVRLHRRVLTLFGQQL